MSTEPMCGDPTCEVCPDDNAIDRWYWRCTNDVRALFGREPISFEAYMRGER